MIGINFDKSRGEQLVAALRDGKPLQPGPSGWSGNDMLSAARALFMAAFSQGPALMTTEKVMELHGEHREMIDQQLMKDLHSAIDFYGNLAIAIFNGTYDDVFEEHIEAVIEATDDGETKVQSVKGFKST